MKICTQFLKYGKLKMKNPDLQKLHVKKYAHTYTLYLHIHDCMLGNNINNQNNLICF